jgi:hypothetical protein
VKDTIDDNFVLCDLKKCTPVSGPHPEFRLVICEAFNIAAEIIFKKAQSFHKSSPVLSGHPFEILLGFWFSHSVDRMVRVLFLCEVSKNLSCKELIYLLVPRYRLCDSRLWIVVNVVFTSMSEKNSTSRFDLGNQIAPLHANSNSSTFLMPGRVSAEKVS